MYRAIGPSRWNSWEWAVSATSDINDRRRELARYSNTGSGRRRISACTGFIAQAVVRGHLSIEMFPKQGNAGS